MKQIIIVIIVATLWGCKKTPTSDNDVKEKLKVEVDTTSKSLNNDVDSLPHKEKKKWKTLSIVGRYDWDGGSWNLGLNIEQNEDTLFFLISSVAYNGGKLRTYGIYDNHKKDIMKFIDQIPKGYPKTFRIWLPLQQFDQKDDSGWATLHFVDKNTIKWSTSKRISYLPYRVTLRRYR